MAGDPAPVPLPDGPVPLEEIHERVLPSVRASLLAAYDLCPLTTLFSLRHGYRVSGPEAAVGILAHRVFAEIGRTLQQTREEVIPVAEALEVLYDVAEQRDVPWYDRVHVPARYWPHLRMVVVKYANDNRFSWDRIVAVERQLRAEVPYVFPDGRTGTRTFTGTPDLLLFDPPDGAICCDAKTGWALPPKPRVTEEDAPGAWSSEKEAQRLSVPGYSQQRHYGYLILANYPSIRYVTMREVYVARNEVREATIYRSDLEHVEREIRLGLQDLDRSLAAGPRHAGSGRPDDPWVAMPGPACQYCLRPNHCPIEADARGSGAITDEETAARFAAEFQVADRVRSHHREALRNWLANAPVPYIELRRAKRRRVIGFNVKEDGSQRFEVFTPEGSDLTPPPVEDPKLEAAFARAAEHASRDRARRKRRRLLDHKPT